MKTRSLFLIAAVSLFAAFSCSKQEEPLNEPQQEAAAVTVPEAVDILTKSLTREDLEDLSLFLKLGDSERSLYLEIVKDGQPLVTGEVSLTAETGIRYIGLDLLALGQIPVAGGIDAWNLAIHMAGAELAKWNPELLAKELEQVNAAVNVSVMYLYRLEFHPVLDEETGAYSIEAFLVDVEDPTSVIPLRQLLALFA